MALKKVEPGDLIRARDWNELIDRVVALEAVIKTPSAPDPGATLELVSGPSIALDRKSASLTYLLTPNVDDDHVTIGALVLDLPGAFGATVALKAGSDLGSEKVGVAHAFAVTISFATLIGSIVANGPGAPTGSLTVTCKGQHINVTRVDSLAITQ